MKIGLTLGKFAPLHKGHQYLIEKALSEVDKLIIVVYDSPDVTDVPLNVRSHWIRNLYRRVTVIDGWNAPSQSGTDPEIMKIQENYILKILGGVKIDRFYSSEFYGDHMSKALGAKNVVVDMDRKKFPISGTEIRKNPFKNREFISTIVYKDLVKNIVFLGAPSTGKSTVAEACAKSMNTEWMPEYGREYWDKHQKNRRLTMYDLECIVSGHIKRENERILKSDKFLFTDSNALTTFLFAQYYHEDASRYLLKAAQECWHRYDKVFLCDTDIPYEDTPDRSGDANREIMQRMTIAYLKTFKINYTLLSGNLEQRVEKVKGAIQWDATI